MCTRHVEAETIYALFLSSCSFHPRKSYSDLLKFLKICFLQLVLRAYLVLISMNNLLL